jgi:RNA-binding protein
VVEVTLAGEDKKYFRTLGHRLKPEVWIGKDGVSPGILKTLENSFHTKELVKVKILGNCPLDRKDIARQLSDAATAEIVQILGNVILLYKPLPEEME